MPPVVLCLLFLCISCSSVPHISLYLLYLWVTCSYVPLVLLCSCSYVSASCTSVLLFFCASCMFLCASCSSVPPVPLWLLFLGATCSSTVPPVPQCLLFLCRASCSSVRPVPLWILFLFAYSSFMSLFLCTQGSFLCCCWSIIPLFPIRSFVPTLGLVQFIPGVSYITSVVPAAVRGHREGSNIYCMGNAMGNCFVLVLFVRRHNKGRALEINCSGGYYSASVGPS